ncbi:hypothetical protein ACG0Z5_01205 [Scandinavium sp. M-37]|uniref:hypothetical protein n=1 Tax=Scandinavium sp. M-37 TaxID=3373077 RepID=UPI003745FECD
MGFRFRKSISILPGGRGTYANLGVGFLERTGSLEDEYIISCRCNRQAMENLNFMGIQNVAPVDALNSHTVIRKMISTFIFQPIEPLTLNAGFN